MTVPHQTMARIGPDIFAVTPVLTERDIVHVRSVADLIDRYELVLRAVERSHSRIRLVPDDQILKLGIDAPRRRKQRLQAVTRQELQSLKTAFPLRRSFQGQSIGL